MAIVHMDGTIAKAWPLSPLQVEKQSVAIIFAVRAVGTPLAGPLSIARSQLANPDFGSLGLSAWPGDKAGSSEFKSSAIGQSFEGD